MAAVAIKFAALLMKTVTKPMTGAIVRYSREQPTFRKFCIGVGSLANKFEKTVTLRLQGVKVKKLKEMDEDEAAAGGAAIISEATVLGIGSLLILLELDRKAKDDAKKAEDSEKKKQKERQELENRLHAIEESLQKLRLDTDTLAQVVTAGALREQEGVVDSYLNRELRETARALNQLSEVSRKIEREPDPEHMARLAARQTRSAP